MIKRYWDFILGGVISLYSLSLVIIWGNISFSYIFLFIGLLIFSHNLIRKKILLKGNLKKLHRVISIFSLVGLIFFILLEGVIIFYPKENKNKSDLLMILGAGVNGKTPSLTLKGRLDKGIEYLKKYDDNTYVVVSGGQGRGEDISEALCMKEYLVQNGVLESKIIMEDKSTSTGENFRFSKEVIKNELGLDVESARIKVITNDFHSFRSNMIGRRNGYENLNFYSSRTYWPLIPIYYVREGFAFLKSYLID